MRHLTLIICLLCFVTFEALANPTEDARAIQPAWQLLTKAYSSGNVGLIREYARHGVAAARLYATALSDLLDRNAASAGGLGEACYGTKPPTPAAAAAYFSCLAAVSTTFLHDFRFRTAAIWRAKLVAFYKAHADAINKATSTDNPWGVKNLHVQSVQAISAWPDETISVKSGWSGTMLADGVGVAHINGTPVRMRVDTGTGFIILSRSQVSELKLKDDLIPIARIYISLTNLGSGTTGELLYVKDFRFGPVTIHNAYVTEWNDDTSVIGMNELRPIGKFSISSQMISPIVAVHGGSCHRMMYARTPITGGESFPFISVQTSYGRMGLMLDSGMRGAGSLKDTVVELAPRMALRLAKSLNQGNSSVTSEIVVEDGRRKQVRTVEFNMKINGREGAAYFSHHDYYDSRLVGALTYNFLKDGVVSYDFNDGVMCIGQKPPSTQAP